MQNKKFTALFTIIASSIPKLSLSIFCLGAMALPSLAKFESVEIVDSPTVNNEGVTIRVKVKQQDGKPSVDLNKDNFKVRVDDREINPDSWKSSKETTAPPANIIVLLDFSASMNGQDRGGQTKIQGSLSAIEKFINSLKQKNNGNSQIRLGIRPFGTITSSRCTIPDPLNLTSIANLKISSIIDNYQKKKPCASTDVYGALKSAVELLLDDEKKTVSPPTSTTSSEEDKKPKPRLAIILLTDGIQNPTDQYDPNQEEKGFNKLINFLKPTQDKITIHTLGYGISRNELKKMFNIQGNNRSNFINFWIRNSGNKDIYEKFENNFVDRERLEEISQLSGGITEVSPNSEEVTAKFNDFLNAILGEYEIGYTSPNADTLSKHGVQVIVTDKINQDSVESKTKRYTILPPSTNKNIRYILLGATIVLLIFGGIIPFKYWTKELQKEAEDI
jgi:uncharacterized protein YegL